MGETPAGLCLTTLLASAQSADKVSPTRYRRDEVTGRMYGDRRTGLTGARPRNDRGAGPACGGDSMRLGLLVSHVSSRADTRPVSLEVEGQLAGRHELLHDLVRDPLAPGLVLCDQGLQDLYERLLELAGEHGSAGVILPETGGREKAPAPPSSARAARPASQPSRARNCNTLSLRLRPSGRLEPHPAGEPTSTVGGRTGGAAPRPCGPGRDSIHRTSFLLQP